MPLLLIYFLPGFAFAVWFAYFKVPVIDAGARNSSFFFKLILLPGAMLLWPLLIIKLINRHGSSSSAKT